MATVTVHCPDVIQMKFTDMDSARLSVRDSAASVVTVYSSFPIAMKPESRESKSKSLICRITAQVSEIPPER